MVIVGKVGLNTGVILLDVVVVARGTAVALVSSTSFAVVSVVNLIVESILTVNDNGVLVLVVFRAFPIVVLLGIVNMFVVVVFILVPLDVSQVSVVFITVAAVDVIAIVL